MVENVTQDTIDTAKIGNRFDARQAGLERRQAATMKSIGETQKKQVDIAAETEQINKTEEPGIVAAEDAVVKKGKEAPSVTGKEERIPDYQRPKMDPKEMHDAFGAMMVASLLVGAASRGPYNVAMSSMTGALEGFVKGDEKVVEESLKTYKTNVDSIKSRNEQFRREVEDAEKKYKNDYAGLKNELSIVYARHDRHLLVQSDKSKSASEQMKLLYRELDAADRAVAANERQYIASLNQLEKTRAGGSIDPKTARFYAMQSIAGDNSWQVGLARGRAGQRLIETVKDLIPQVAAELGLSPQDVGTNKATNVALSAALRDRTKYVAAGNQFVANMKEQITLVRKYMQAGSATGSPAINRWIQAGRVKIAGDEDVTNLDTAIRGLAREHQRIVTGVTSNAQLHVAAQATADELLNRSMSETQMVGVMHVMEEEANNAIKAGQGEITSLQGQLRSLGGGKPTPGAGAAPTQADRDWAKAHPEDAAKFKAHFGVDP